MQVHEGKSSWTFQIPVSSFKLKSKKEDLESEIEEQVHQHQQRVKLDVHLQTNDAFFEAALRFTFTNK